MFIIKAVIRERVTSVTGGVEVTGLYLNAPQGVTTLPSYKVSFTAASLTAFEAAIDCSILYNIVVEEIDIIV